MILRRVQPASLVIFAGFLASLLPLRTEAAVVEAAAKKDSTTVITVRAGKADNPNYVLARQFSEALALASNGALSFDVKESQGTVENVINAPKNLPNTIFTASRSVVLQARRGNKPFPLSRGYDDIRALFPIPSQTLHWVVRQDSGIQSLADLAGHNFIPGPKGSISERVTSSALQALDMDKKAQLLELDVASAPDAVMNNHVSGLALAGSFPLPRVLEIAKATPIRLLGLAPATISKMVAADDTIIPQTVPKGTYPGVDADVSTVAVPVGFYTTRRMSNDTAYALTKAFWSQIPAMAVKNPAWQAMTGLSVATLGIKLHPGALRFYREARIAVPASLR